MNSKVSEQIKFLRLNQKAVIPKFAHFGDAGMDLYSTVEYTLEKKEVFAVPLGFSTSFSSDYVAMICPRSGLALNNKITVLNSPGIVDSNFSGEWKVILINHGISYKINIGDRVAQVFFNKINSVYFKEVDFISDSNRGNHGFGSTGK